MEIAGAIVIIAGVFLSVFLAAIVGAILNGWVLSVLWGWFMVPLLGLPPLSVPAAMGISLVVTFITHQYQPEAAKDESQSGWDRLLHAVTHLLARPLLVLLVGWIIKHYV